MRLIKRFPILDIIFFAVPLVCGIGYLLAFYPGIITFDSIAQWHQVSSFSFDNWHPAYHSILIWLITRLRDTLAIFVLFQVCVFSAVLAYGLRAFKDMGVPAPMLVILAIFISIVPMNGLLVVTIWKDILFSTAVLLLAIVLLKIIMSGGAWLANGWNALLLGVTAANVSLLRHNGFPVAFGMLLIIALVYSRRKWVFLALGIAVLCIGFIVGPVYEVFRVNRQQSQSFGVVFIHPIAAHVRNEASFSLDEQAYLKTIFPLEIAWPYSCHDATVLFYSGVNFSEVQKDPMQAAKIFGRLSLEAPLVTARHFYCLSSFVWQISQPDGVYLETVVTTNHTAGHREAWRKYQPYIEQNSRAPELRNLITSILERYARFDPGMIGWRPAIYLYVFSAAVVFLAFRRKNPLILILLVPVYLQTLIIAFTAQLQAVRYQYPVYLVSMLFTVPLIYLAVKQPNPKQPEQTKPD